MAYRWQDCYCRECECMDMNDAWKYDKSKRYCSERREYYNPNDRACSRMKYDYSRSPYYIATLINNILDCPDNGYALEQIQFLRDEYMMNHPEHYTELIEYDLIGPRIADAIAEDSLGKLIARTFYQSYIMPIAIHIQRNEYEIAIEKYKEMIFRLKNIYQIDNTITTKLNINTKTLGMCFA